MSKNLEGAKQSYQKALSIYPSESYPKDMIEKINTALKDQVSADDLYASAISAADQFMASADYANALQEYGIAKDLKPEEAYPTRKIDEINTILKAEEEGEQEYALAINLGDQYLNAGALAEAKTEFEKALAIKPGEAYPAERLSRRMMPFSTTLGIILKLCGMGSGSCMFAKETGGSESFTILKRTRERLRMSTTRIPQS